jgi:hypothetical protein
LLKAGHRYRWLHQHFWHVSYLFTKQYERFFPFFGVSNWPKWLYSNSPSSFIKYKDPKIIRRLLYLLPSQRQQPSAAYNHHSYQLAIHRLLWHLLPRTSPQRRRRLLNQQLQTTTAHQHSLHLLFTTSALILKQGYVRLKLLIQTLANLFSLPLGFILFIFLTLIVRVILSPILSMFFVAITYSYIWLPQIVRSACRGRTSGLTKEYIIGTTICRLFGVLCEFYSCFWWMNPWLILRWTRFLSLPQERAWSWTQTYGSKLRSSLFISHRSSSCSLGLPSHNICFRASIFRYTAGRVWT